MPTQPTQKPPTQKSTQKLPAQKSTQKPPTQNPEPLKEKQKDKKEESQKTEKIIPTQADPELYSVNDTGPSKVTQSTGFFIS